MPLANIYQIAGSAMNAQTVRLSTVASNLANADSVAGSEAQTYRAMSPIFASVYQQASNGLNQPLGTRENWQGASVAIIDVVSTDAEPKRRLDPNNPLADDDGYVYYPDIDVVSEMANMMSASRHYETNIEVLQNVKSMQQGLLKLGEG